MFQTRHALFAIPTQSSDTKSSKNGTMSGWNGIKHHPRTLDQGASTSSFHLFRFGHLCTIPLLPYSLWLFLFHELKSSPRPHRSIQNKEDPSNSPSISTPFTPIRAYSPFSTKLCRAICPISSFLSKRYLELSEGRNLSPHFTCWPRFNRLTISTSGNKKTQQSRAASLGQLISHEI